MAAYYNEIDPFAASWLRELIKADLIAAGDVDERSIVDVSADDVRGYTQAHFFAGIGGWDYALKLAGWGSEPAWTGSCPCQPLSSAGKRQGHADRRHLWPAFYRLIAECRPPVVFGEQVASADGREWFAGVRVDLETLEYACGCADLCAASVGSPQVRQRLYWVADGAVQRTGQLPIRQRRQNQDERHALRSASDLRISDSSSERPRSSQSGNSPQETDIRWPHDAPPNRRFTDEFGNTYRIPEPGISFLDDGFPGILDHIRPAGNAIVPQVAAAFIGAYMELA